MSKIMASLIFFSKDLFITFSSAEISICSSSFDNKAMIFTEDGWYHFERIYKKHPLKSLQFLQDIFDLDNY